jgi:predicted ATPase
MIEKASFRNIRSLRQVDVDFERLTMVIGPNASGKTSILEGLWLLSRCLGSIPKEILTEQWRPGLILSRGVQDQSLEIVTFEPNLTVRLQCGFDWPLVGEELVAGVPVDWEQEPRLEWKKPGEEEADWKVINMADGAKRLPREVMSASIPYAQLLRLDASKLSEPSFSEQPKPRVGPSGKMLASALAFLALNQPDQFQSLQDQLRSIIPSVERIRFDRVTITRNENVVNRPDLAAIVGPIKRQHVGDVIVIDFKGARGVPAAHVSEGTLLVLALLTAMLNPVRPKLLLIDDLDRGLHPKAQRKLIPMIRAIQDQNPDLQVIATTHSPYIVDELDPKDIRVTWAGEDGATSCARLDQHPDLDRWKDEMWPGEFWSLVGEQWVANGQSSESR